MKISSAIANRLFISHLTLSLCTIRTTSIKSDMTIILLFIKIYSLAVFAFQRFIFLIATCFRMHQHIFAVNPKVILPLVLHSFFPLCQSFEDETNEAFCTALMKFSFLRIFFMTNTYFVLQIFKKQF